MTANQPKELRRIYGVHFEKNLACLRRVWSLLVRDFCQERVSPSATVLDLGCGYGEFINNIQCGRRPATDLNPDAPRFLAADVRFSSRLVRPGGNVMIIPWTSFSPAFFEHLPDKSALKLTLEKAFRCLKPGESCWR